MEQATLEKDVVDGMVWAEEKGTYQFANLVEQHPHMDIDIRRDMLASICDDLDCLDGL